MIQGTEYSELIKFTYVFIRFYQSDIIIDFTAAITLQTSKMKQ